MQQQQQPPHAGAAGGTIHGHGGSGDAPEGRRVCGPMQTDMGVKATAATAPLDRLRLLPLLCNADGSGKKKLLFSECFCDQYTMHGLCVC
jgi:hypothetical protein